MNEDEADLEELEAVACTPRPIAQEGFNPNTFLPYGCTLDHIHLAMNEYINFLGFINQQLHTKGIKRLESMLMPANFSSMVGEFMNATLPKYCSTLVKNQYHNGHPDLIPAGRFPDDAVQHAEEGIEVKGSRYVKAWQGHNAENAWLMVFVFDSNRPVDTIKGIKPKPLQFIKVVGARLSKSDWKEDPRKEGSRRTNTATVLDSGYEKMMANWIYVAPGSENQALEDPEEDQEAVQLMLLPEEEIRLPKSRKRAKKRKSS